MNYYPFHLGDYAAHTGHLEPMEDLAYRRLLDVYYMREWALPADIQVTAKLVRLRSCAADVESVLNEFFVLTEDGWRHQRCEHEIAKMQDKQAKARASAQASVNSRRAKAERSLDETPTNAERQLPVSQADVEPPTPTPTPRGIEAIASHPERRSGVHRFPPGFDEFWAAYPRKVGKDAAAKAFAKRRVGVGLLAQMLAAISTQKTGEQWRRDGGQFIPHPATWLNEGRWQDETPGVATFDAVFGAAL